MAPSLGANGLRAGAREATGGNVCDREKGNCKDNGAPWKLVAMCWCVEKREPDTNERWIEKTLTDYSQFNVGYDCVT